MIITVLIDCVVYNVMANTITHLLLSFYTSYFSVVAFSYCTTELLGQFYFVNYQICFFFLFFCRAVMHHYIKANSLYV